MSVQEIGYFVTTRLRQHRTFSAAISLRRVTFGSAVMASTVRVRLYRYLVQRSSMSGLIGKLNASWMTIDPGWLFSRSVFTGDGRLVC